MAELSLDVSTTLMVLLPPQSVESWLESVAALMYVGPQHASLYLLEIYPNATEHAEATMAMLQDAGFNVKLNMLEVAEWVDTYTKPYAEDRPPQLVQTQHDNNNGDAVFTVFFKYHSDGAQSVLSNQELDALIENALRYGGGEITVVSRPGGVEVLDRGPGFDGRRRPGQGSGNGAGPRSAGSGDQRSVSRSGVTARPGRTGAAVTASRDRRATAP